MPAKYLEKAESSTSSKPAQVLDRSSRESQQQREEAPRQGVAVEPAEVVPKEKKGKCPFDHAAMGDFTAALTSSQRAINAATGSSERGYLMQQFAAYQHQVNPALAQQTQKAANKLNRSLLGLFNSLPHNTHPSFQAICTLTNEFFGNYGGRYRLLFGSWLP